MSSKRTNRLERNLNVSLDASVRNVFYVTRLEPIWQRIICSTSVLPSSNPTTERPKPYKLIGFGDIHGPKPYEFIGFGDIHGHLVPGSSQVPGISGTRLYPCPGDLPPPCIGATLGPQRPSSIGHLVGPLAA